MAPPSKREIDRERQHERLAALGIHGVVGGLTDHPGKVALQGIYDAAELRRIAELLDACPLPSVPGGPGSGEKEIS